MAKAFQYGRFDYQLEGQDLITLNTFISAASKSESEKQLNDALTQVEEKAGQHEWLTSLHDDIARVAKQGIEDWDDPFYNWLMDIEFSFGKLPGIDEFGGRAGLKEAGFNSDAPHLGWMRILMDKHEALLAKDASMDPDAVFRYLWIGADEKVPCETFIDLYDDVLKPEFFGLGLSNYVNWFARSELIMDGNKINMEQGKKMGRTLERWLESGELDEAMLKNLYRNFDVHPRHRDVVKQWAEDYSKLIDKSKTNNNDLEY